MVLLLLMMAGSSILRPQSVQFQTIDYPGGIATAPQGVNNNGDVVGVYLDSAFQQHGFRWSKGTFTTVDCQGSVAIFSGINDAGDLVGTCVVNGRTLQGFLIRAGTSTPTYLPFPSEVTFQANAKGINNSGQIVGVYLEPPLGTSFVRGVIWSGAGIEKIDYPGAYPNPVSTTAPSSIDNAGRVVGWQSANVLFQGFLLSDGQYSLLTYPDSYQTLPYGVSAAGVVGAFDTNFSHGCFLLRGGQYSQFSLPGVQGVACARGISDTGFTVGTYVGSDGNSHGFFATPSICGDERDQIIQEYIDHHVVFWVGTSPQSSAPRCADFTKNITENVHTHFFSFSDLNKSVNPASGNSCESYSWIVLRSPLLAPASQGYGLDAWVSKIGDPPALRSLTSAYRNPEHNFAAREQCKGAASMARNSRHMFGDAVDMEVIAGTACRNAGISDSNCDAGRKEWEKLFQAAGKAKATTNELMGGPCKLLCVHADWRMIPGPYLTPQD